MKLKTIAVLLMLASLAGFAFVPSTLAGSCSHCVFDDNAPVQPAPKRMAD